MLILIDVDLILYFHTYYLDYVSEYGGHTVVFVGGLRTCVSRKENGVTKIMEMRVESDSVGPSIDTRIVLDRSSMCETLKFLDRNYLILVNKLYLFVMPVASFRFQYHSQSISSSPLCNIDLLSNDMISA